MMLTGAERLRRCGFQPGAWAVWIAGKHKRVASLQCVNSTSPAVTTTPRATETNSRGEPARCAAARAGGESRGIRSASPCCIPAPRHRHWSAVSGCDQGVRQSVAERAVRRPGTLLRDKVRGASAIPARPSMLARLRRCYNLGGRSAEPSRGAQQGPM